MWKQYIVWLERLVSTVEVGRRSLSLYWTMAASSSSSSWTGLVAASSYKNKTHKGFSLLTLKPRFSPSLRIQALSSNDFKVGTAIELDGAPWRVQEFLHVKPGKGAAFVRTKLRNFVTGNTVDRTFRAGENVSEASVMKELKQFTYKDSDQFVFMDMSTFEEVRLTEADMGDKSKFLKEGMECNVLTWNSRVIDVDLPITVKLEVVATDPGVKGDTAQGGSKPATLDTGATVNVPLFVNIGDQILVDSRTGTYISRG